MVTRSGVARESAQQGDNLKQVERVVLNVLQRRERYTTITERHSAAIASAFEPLKAA